VVAIRCYPQKPIFNLIRRALGVTRFRATVVGVSGEPRYIAVKYGRVNICEIRATRNNIEVYSFWYGSCNAEACLLRCGSPTLTVIADDPEFPATILAHMQVLKRRQQSRWCYLRRLEKQRAERAERAERVMTECQWHDLLSNIDASLRESVAHLEDC